MAKKLSDLSSDDLANLLSGDSPALPEVQDTPPVLAFIDRFGLKSGKTQIWPRLLWNLFIKYGGQLTLIQFTRQAATILEYRNKKFHLDADVKLLFYELKPKEKVNKQPIGLDRHMQNFIARSESVPYNKAVPSIVFYDIYRNHCIDIGYRNPKSPATFNNYMKLHFKHVTQGELLFYVQSPALKLLNKGDHEEIRKKYKKPRTAKKRQQKIQKS